MLGEIVKCQYPFSSIYGAERAKLALMCIAVDRRINGLLIRGPAGTGKSTLARSIKELDDREIITIPQNITDEQLFGGLDFNTAVTTGNLKLSRSTLSRADGNIAYVDNINLFEENSLSALTEAIDSKEVIIEREGVSAHYSVNATIIATMDPMEQMLTDSVLDRFDMCVDLMPPITTYDRSNITKSVLDYSADPVSFILGNIRESRSLIDKVQAARNIIGGVTINRKVAMTISDVCKKLGIESVRGDIAVARVSRAIAALNGHLEPFPEDIAEASVLCLVHRKPELSSDEDDEEEDNVDLRKIVDEEQFVREEDFDFEAAAVNLNIPKQKVVVEKKKEIIEPEEEKEKPKTMAELIFEDLEGQISEIEAACNLRLRNIVGIRRRTYSAGKAGCGRVRGYKLPSGQICDPALDATIRAAAPHQRYRKHRNLSIDIKQEDIREKVRIRPVRNSFLFMVDVSGSLTSGHMMRYIQMAIRSMLSDTYVHRDNVALITFRSMDAVISVPFTRNVEDVYEALDATITGDNTPLNPALMLAKEYLESYQKKNPDANCHVILVTDGDGNISCVKGAESMVELRRMAPSLYLPKTDWTIIDPTDLADRNKAAVRLAKFLDARLIALSDLDDE